MNISLAKMIALVYAFAKLHNFCIDEEKDDKHICERIMPDILQNYVDHMMLQEEGYTTMDFN